MKGVRLNSVLQNLLLRRGQNVKLTFKNLEGFHDLVFDNLPLETKQIKAGEEDIVEFTAPTKPGEYTFYCSVGNHQGYGNGGKDGCRVMKD